MKPKILLRVASLIMFLHTIGHKVGALRSVGDFYEGYGMTMIFVLLLMAVLLWQLSSISIKYPFPAARLLIPISLSLLATSLMEFMYFFLLAASFSLIAGLLSGWSALFILKNRTTAD